MTESPAATSTVFTVPVSGCVDEKTEKDIIDRLRVAQKEVYTRAWEKSIGIRKSERARRKWVI